MSDFYQLLNYCEHEVVTMDATIITETFCNILKMKPRWRIAVEDLHTLQRSTVGSKTNSRAKNASEVHKKMTLNLRSAQFGPAQALDSHTRSD